MRHKQLRGIKPRVMQLEDRVVLSTVINYEGYSSKTAITNQYDSIGVDFSGATILTQGQSLSSHFPPHSGVNVIYNSASNTIKATAEAGTQWSDAGAYVTGDAATVMTAYNAAGAVVGMVKTAGSNTTATGTPNILLEVKGSGISYVTFVCNTKSDTFTVDDFSFQSTLTQPNLSTDYGAVVALLLVENQTPYVSGYIEANTKVAMNAMVATVHNRLTMPKLFNASGATTVSQIIGAPGQFAGFSNRNGGGVIITSTLQTLINQIFSIANTSGSYQTQFIHYIQDAESIAKSYVDPFASVGGTYGWRTAGSSDPGGSLVPIKNGVIAGNKFYRLEI